MPMDGYYPASGAGDQDAEHDAGAEAPGKEDGMDSETALLPKSILAGKHFDPGDEVVLKIVKMHGDEVEVAYATGKETDQEDEHGEGEGKTPEMDGAMGKLDAMGSAY